MLPRDQPGVGSVRYGIDFELGDIPPPPDDWPTVTVQSERARNTSTYKHTRLFALQFTAQSHDANALLNFISFNLDFRFLPFLPFFEVISCSLTVRR